MTVSKETIYKSVRYISKDGHSDSEQAPSISREREREREREIYFKRNTRKKNASNNKLPQKNKKSLKKTTGEGFTVVEWIILITKLLLIKNYTKTIIEQTKTKPKAALEFKLEKQMVTFSFSPTENFSEEGIWLRAVTSFEASNSFINITYWKQ